MGLILREFTDNLDDGIVYGGKATGVKMKNCASFLCWIRVRGLSKRYSPRPAGRGSNKNKVNASPYLGLKVDKVWAPCLFRKITIRVGFLDLQYLIGNLAYECRNFEMIDTALADEFIMLLKLL
ncbi:hypothetical protein FQA39_LY04973 [Lamprigera yunnana]|nr:hypothetical protein FQA39_LY04973 [Lamprigera yunnana]